MLPLLDACPDHRVCQGTCEPTDWDGKGRKSRTEVQTLPPSPSLVCVLASEHSQSSVSRPLWQWWAGRSYLGVPHAGRSDQCLLDGVALLEHALLLPRHGPVALDQELHHLQVSSESSVNQSALTVFVQMIHLEQRRQNTMKPKHEQNIFASSEFPAPVAK